MGTVVLMGYSTSGKSTILRDMEKNFGDCLQTIDTDDEVALDFDGHIYNVYLRLTNVGNRQKALDHIKKKEEQLLANLYLTNTPRLMAAGPALPSRTEWNSFVKRVNPICFYLEITAREVYDGLRWRRCRHLELLKIRDDRNFGCWDEGTTTKYKNGRWVVVSEEAIANIEREMEPLVSIYKTYCNDRKFSVCEIRDCKETKEELYRQIKASLGL